jgi:hypothetical protein
MAKSVRHRLGKENGLPREGLTKREWSSRQAWLRLSEAEKDRRTSVLREINQLTPAAGIGDSFRDR